MAYGTRAQFEPVRELAFGSIGAAYAALGTPLVDHARIIRFVNSTNVEVYITNDTTENQLRLAAGSFVLYDFSTNKIRDDGLFVHIGTQFYTKSVAGAPASGAVWAEVISAQGGV